MSNFGSFSHYRKNSSQDVGNYLIRFPKNTKSNCTSLYILTKSVSKKSGVKNDGKASADWTSDYLSVDPKSLLNFKK